MVVLDNRHRILGKVVPHDDPAKVAIDTGTGTIVIARSGVADVQLSLASRLRLVAAAPDDLALRVATAQWCRSRQNDAEALKLLEDVRDRADLDVEALGLLARLIDETKGRGAAEAFDVYLRYRERGGKDSLHLARLARLEAAKAAYNAQHAALVVPAVAAADGVPAAPAAAAPPPAPAMNEGLETRGFAPEKEQWSNPIAVEVVTVGAGSDRRRMLQLTFQRGDKGKAAVERRVNWTVTDDSLLAFFIANRTGKPIRIAIALKTGPQWDFFESIQETVSAEESFQEMKFDLKSDRFKCKASNWTANAKVDNLTDIKAIQVLIYNGDLEGSVIIGGMGFRKPGPM